ncbi:FmdB family zinc ribbon protein [Desulfovibrio psychrotolerans]|uniref:Putative regulatory protein FmdB zinc ribbon domain-containing protein n=1 Tax=Desulfovibrio psychrotolerans TaxID=415242 RepID=A0A7J0BQB4_9BACT|nr:zinc ribbon domain-containing protein [Desulfovibrio psychrotolerans]GFM35850.1 hypothetical protein DSM19430T_05340 [Desulfovibrio psychrotolerans]
MPLYDFECRVCGGQFEELAHPDSTGGETCPACGSTDTERRLSAHSPLPGSGTNRVPGSLLRGGGAKMENVPMPKLKKPIPKRPVIRPGGCGSPGGCGGCSGAK